MNRVSKMSLALLFPIFANLSVGNAEDASSVEQFSGNETFNLVRPVVYESEDLRSEMISVENPDSDVTYGLKYFVEGKEMGIKDFKRLVIEKTANKIGAIVAACRIGIVDRNNSPKGLKYTLDPKKFSVLGFADKIVEKNLMGARALFVEGQGILNSDAILSVSNDAIYTLGCGEFFAQAGSNVLTWKNTASIPAVVSKHLRGVLEIDQKSLKQMPTRPYDNKHVEGGSADPKGRKGMG